jgi:hypothetical protein
MSTPARILVGFPLPLAWIMLAATCARADDRYYIVVFGSQSIPKLPSYTHTWATLVKTTGAGSDPEGCRFEAATISWLPTTLKIHSFRLRAEPGTNFDLHTTFQFVLSQKQRVSQWGPYEITCDAYCQFINKIADLECGKVRYKARDPIFKNARISDCIHAVSDVDSRQRIYYSEVLRCGESASNGIVRALRARGKIIDPDKTHDWINERLELQQYPIVHKPIRPSVIELLKDAIVALVIKK